MVPEKLFNLSCSKSVPDIFLFLLRAHSETPRRVQIQMQFCYEQVGSWDDSVWNRPQAVSRSIPCPKQVQPWGQVAQGFIGSATKNILGKTS